MLLHCHCEPEGRGNLFLYIRLFSFTRNDILFNAFILAIKYYRQCLEFTLF
jgi:hypothetical protein